MLVALTILCISTFFFRDLSKTMGTYRASWECRHVNAPRVAVCQKSPQINAPDSYFSSGHFCECSVRRQEVLGVGEVEVLLTRK